MNEADIETLAIKHSSARTIVRNNLVYCMFTQKGLVRFTESVRSADQPTSDDATIERLKAEVESLRQDKAFIDYLEQARTINFSHGDSCHFGMGNSLRLRLASLLAEQSKEQGDRWESVESADRSAPVDLEQLIGMACVPLNLAKQGMLTREEAEAEARKVLSAYPSVMAWAA